jgi:hypothetical protein
MDTQHRRDGSCILILERKQNGSVAKFWLHIQSSFGDHRVLVLSIVSSPRPGSSRPLLSSADKGVDIRAGVDARESRDALGAVVAKARQCLGGGGRCASDGACLAKCRLRSKVARRRSIRRTSDAEIAERACCESRTG